MADEKTPDIISTASQTDSQEDFIEPSFTKRECPSKNLCVVYSSRCNLIYVFIFVSVFLILKYFMSSFQQLQSILYSMHSLLSDLNFNILQFIHLNKVCCNKQEKSEIKSEIKQEVKAESEKKTECKDELNLKNMVQIIENLETLFRSG